MRRVLLALTLVLAACSAPEEPVAQPFSVEVSGELGEPSLATVAGDTPEDASVTVDTEGSGIELTAESPVLYTVYSFDDDRQELAGSESPILATAGELPIDVVGMREGTRVLSLNPQEGGAEILVYDILHTTVPDRSDELSGPFTVTTDDNNIPTLEGTEDVRLLSTTVISRGDGPQVTVQDEVYVQYSVYRGEDGELIDSTWGQGPILLELGDTFEGLRTGAAEVPVGSRLLITVPAAQAQGTEDLVIIIDLLVLG